MTRDTQIRAGWRPVHGLSDPPAVRNIELADTETSAAKCDSLSLDRIGSPRGAWFPFEIIAGRFRIIRFIDRGGMGEVYEAEDLALRSRRRVALKIVRREIASNGAILARFEREVEIGKEITHHNVCRTYDLGFHHASDSSGKSVEVLFLTMELLHGSTLAIRLSREGPLTTSEALPLIRQLAEALNAVHDAGIVHCDLKPGNIMLAPVEKQLCPRVVLTDFGLARRFRVLEPNREFTTFLASADGTPDYMSPEQVRGIALGPASDIYALGLLIYRMLTGTLPFSGTDAHSRMRRRLEENPPSPRRYVEGLAPEWDRVILKCLSIDPGQRFTSAREVASALSGCRTSVAAF